MSSLLVSAALVGCLQAPATLPSIAIIIDDLGNRSEQDYAILELPGLVTLAILPFSPLTQSLAKSAHTAGRQVLLHLPMEATSKNHLLGPGALRSTMAYDEFVATVRKALADVPHLVGVNNHMGSLLTQDKMRMDWLMSELHATPGLIYVDSRTTSNSAAGGAARHADVPYLARDVFLDNQRSPSYIHAHFDALVEHAQRQGDAIGIAHPHPETIKVLRQRLAELSEVELVSITTLIASRKCRGNPQHPNNRSMSTIAQSEQDSN
jgi:polysaccharide deacetylase 2 family uncharacterized protein YibQ